MKKIISLFALMLLVGAGCSQVVDNKKNAEVKDDVTKKVNIVEDIQEVELLDTSDWETFENKKYGYTFKYPDNQDVGINKNTIESENLIEPERLSNVYVKVLRNGLYEDGLRKFFNIVNFTEYSEYLDEEKKLSLVRYVDLLWQKNWDLRNFGDEFKDYELGDIEKVEISGNLAYRFYVDGPYEHFSAGGIVWDTFLYAFDQGDYRYFIEVTNEPYAMTMLNSLKFNRQ